MRRTLRLLKLGPWYLARAIDRRFPRRLWRLVLVPLALLAVGTISYPLIEGEPWTLFDGFYMTAITLTTIGYGEIPEPLSKPGRMFTVVLAYGGIFTLAYVMTEVVRSVLSGEVQQILGRQRMEEELALVEGHLIVCGLGRMGKIVCLELEHQKEKFVVIDTAVPEADWPYRHGYRVHGNATDDAILRKAGIERAQALITVVGSDADNLYITLSARLLCPKLFIVARAEEEDAEAKLRKVGANKVISPYLSGGYRAVQAVLRPTVLHFVEMATRPEFVDLQLEEIHIEQGCLLAGKTLRDARLSQDFGVIVIGIQRPTGELIYGPQGETVLEAAATLIAIGERRQLDRLEALAKKE